MYAYKCVFVYLIVCLFVFCVYACVKFTKSLIISCIVISRKCFPGASLRAHLRIIQYCCTPHSPLLLDLRGDSDSPLSAEMFQSKLLELEFIRMADPVLCPLHHRGGKCLCYSLWYDHKLHLLSPANTETLS